MNNITSCKITLLNKTYELKCPEGEERNLQLAAKKLNEHMRANKNKFKKLDDYKILLLAALDISHELTLCKSDQEYQRYQVNQFITSLENKINRIVSSNEEDSIPQTD